MTDGTVSTQPVQAPAPAAWDFRGDGINTYTLEEVDDHLETSLGYDVADDMLATALREKKDGITDADLDRLDGMKVGLGRDGKLTEAELEFDSDGDGGNNDAKVTVGGPGTTILGDSKTYTVSSYADKLEGTGKDIDERGLLELLNEGKDEGETDWTFTSAFTEQEALERLGQIDPETGEIIKLDDADIDTIRAEATTKASDDGNKSRVKYQDTKNIPVSVASLAKSAETALTQAGYTGEYANIDEKGLASLLGFGKNTSRMVSDRTIKNRFDTGQDDGVLDIFEIQAMQKQAKDKALQGVTPNFKNINPVSSMGATIPPKFNYKKPITEKSLEVGLESALGALGMKNVNITRVMESV